MALKPPLTILLCAPRGFCAGVVRAIDVVETALKTYGAPVYVRHEIVHNRFVVDDLKRKGAIFVRELDEIPETEAPVIFSAHGVPKSVPAEAARRNFFAIDATCPLVTKVHNEAKHFEAKGYFMIYIGHEGHVEAEGTMGEAPDRMVLVETPEDARKLDIPHYEKLAVLTQTTLSVDEVRATMEVLKERYPHIHTPTSTRPSAPTRVPRLGQRKVAKFNGWAALLPSCFACKCFAHPCD